MAQKKGSRGIPSRKKPAAADDQRSRLLRMLADAADQIDAEGLLFLVRQANVLVHNQKVDEVNREMAELSVKRPRHDTPSSPSRPAVVVQDDGDKAAVFITVGPARKVLDRNEVKRLVRICYAADSKSDSLRQLYTVLKRERADIVNDAGITSPASPLMEGLFAALRERYQLDDR